MGNKNRNRPTGANEQEVVETTQSAPEAPETPVVEPTQQEDEIVAPEAAAGDEAESNEGPVETPTDVQEPPAVDPDAAAEPEDENEELAEEALESTEPEDEPPVETEGVDESVIDQSDQGTDSIEGGEKIDGVANDLENTNTTEEQVGLSDAQQPDQELGDAPVESASEPTPPLDTASEETQVGDAPLVSVTEETKAAVTETIPESLVEIQEAVEELQAEAISPIEHYKQIIDNETRTLTEDEIIAARETLISSVGSDIDVADAMTYIRRLAAQVHHGVEHWTDYSLTKWAKEGKMPEVVDGLLVHDAVREKKDLKAFSDAELSGVLMRKLRTSRYGQEDVAKEIIRRNALSPLLTIEKVRNWLSTNVVPETLYAESDLFQLKPAYYWTDLEISKFFKGELNETKAVQSADIYDEYRRRHGLSKTTYSDKQLQGLQGTDKNGVKVHMALTILTNELKKYAEKMAPSAAISEDGAGKMQESLYRQMNRVLSLPGQDFVSGWTEILDFFYTNKDSHFNEAAALRGLGFMSISNRDRFTFEQLVDLCVRTCDPKVRYNAAKNVNFGVVLSKITSEAIRQRVLEYYRVGQ